MRQAHRESQADKGTTDAVEASDKLKRLYARIAYLRSATPRRPGDDRRLGAGHHPPPPPPPGGGMGRHILLCLHAVCIIEAARCMAACTQLRRDECCIMSRIIRFTCAQASKTTLLASNLHFNSSQHSASYDHVSDTQSMTLNHRSSWAEIPCAGIFVIRDGELVASEARAEKRCVAATRICKLIPVDRYLAPTNRA